MRLNLTKHPRYLPPLLRMHRQHVDDGGPVVAMSVAVAEELRGDCVGGRPVSDEDVAKVFVGSRTQCGEQDAEVVVHGLAADVAHLLEYLVHREDLSKQRSDHLQGRRLRSFGVGVVRGGPVAQEQDPEVASVRLASSRVATDIRRDAGDERISVVKPTRCNER